MPWRSISVRLGGDAKGDLRQDGQLVGGVGAVHVERRVGLGVAEPLGLGQRRRVVDAALGHGREDEVPRAVEDALNRRDLIGGQALAEGADDRHAAGHGRLEADGLAGRRAASNTSPPRFRQQRLVRRDHVLAGGERACSTISLARVVPPISSTTT